MKKAFLLPFLIFIFLFNGAQLPNIKPSSLKVKIVVIDAGHGGKDPGCHGDLYKEKDIALAVSLKLGKFIEENFKDVQVIFTRKTDVFVELNERAAIANRNNADLFICVHCNSACVYNKRTRKETCNEDAHGAETYVMGVHKNAGNLEVAKRENQSILLEDDYKKKYDGFDPNSDEANIIFTFYQNVFLNQSLSLATKIQEGYKQKAGRTDKGVKQAGFLVLWRTAMPSLLTEIGYLTNHKEERFLGSEKGQSYMASSIFRAFRLYKNDVEGTNIKYADEFEKPATYDTTDESTERAPANTPRKEGTKEELKEKSGIRNTKSGKTTIGNDSTPDDKFNNAMSPPKNVTAGLKPEPSTPKASAVTSESNNPVTTAEEIPATNTQSPPSEAVKHVVVAENVPPPVIHEKVYKVIFYASEKKLDLSDSKFANVPEKGSFQEGAITKYTSGHFETPQDAAKAQAEIRKLGFKDAFVALFQDGKRVK